MARYVLKLLVGWSLWLWFTALIAVPAWAAQILVSPATDKVTQITITGDMDLDDAIEFQRETGAIEEAVVVLRSSGGNAAAGVSIGRFIRKKGFLTVVPFESSCASACALAWLGGMQRFMGEDAKIGFHAAYTLRGGRPRRNSSANEVMAEYVNELGLPPQAVSYITDAPPERMYWLSLAAAQAVGIDAAPYAADGIASAPAQTRLLPMTIQQATDYPGNDVGRLRQTTLVGCLVACSEDASCKAFTFVTRREECWLKNAIGSAEPRAGLISGIK